MTLEFELLQTPNCPHAPPTRRRVREILETADLEWSLESSVVTSEDDAKRLDFRGSPTLLIDGRDVDPFGHPEPSFACRLYPNGEGTPPKWMIETGLLAALRPERIAFLCVGNSARSQMAEALLRHLAPSADWPLTVRSAGSDPGEPHPLALDVLAELDAEPDSPSSDHVDELDLSRTDAIVTLCDDEVCPVAPDVTLQFDWPFEDPARSDDVDVFRRVRDDLHHRLKHVVA